MKLFSLFLMKIIFLNTYSAIFLRLKKNLSKSYIFQLHGEVIFYTSISEKLILAVRENKDSAIVCANFILYSYV